MLWALSVVAALALGAWAAWATLLPPATASESDVPTLYAITTGTVSRSQTFTAEAEWAITPGARNAASGTVTSIDIEPGEEVQIGQVLYSVDLRPTLAAEGSVPAFRALSSGMHGADVTQLQQFLAVTGFLGTTPSGAFDSSTLTAVQAWQKSLGVVSDGVVQASDLLYFSHLPSRVSPAPSFGVGSRVGGGEPAIDLLSVAPTFTITLGIEQAELVPLVSSVEVHHRDGSWQGEIVSSTTAPTGELMLTLGGPDGRPLCAESCTSVPVGDPSLYQADLIAVPETSGPVVPLAALSTLPDGTAFVTAQDGSPLPVTILAAAEGRAVVSGVEAGTEIQLLPGGAAAEGNLP